MSIGKITWTKFVRHEDIDAHKALGWTCEGSLIGTHHGHWSTIMKWNGEGEPVVPRNTAEKGHDNGF